MPMAPAYMRMLRLRHRNRPIHLKPLQNRAMLPTGIAAPAQLHQLPLQCHQPVNPRLHVLDMLVDQRIDAFTLVLRAVP